MYIVRIGFFTLTHKHVEIARMELMELEYFVELQTFKIDLFWGRFCRGHMICYQKSIVHVTCITDSCNVIAMKNCRVKSDCGENRHKKSVIGLGIFISCKSIISETILVD